MFFFIFIVKCFAFDQSSVSLPKKRYSFFNLTNSRLLNVCVSCFPEKYEAVQLFIIQPEFQKLRF